MKSILDRSFRYTPSVETDLRKTFARIRRRQKETDSENQQTNAESTNVLPIDMKKLAGNNLPFPKSV